MESHVRNVPLLMVQDPLAAAGAVVLDCRPRLLPVSMDISGVDLSGSGYVRRGWSLRGGGGGGRGDLLSMIYPELGVTPLVDPGTDLEDELPTPAASPVTVHTVGCGR